MGYLKSEDPPIPMNKLAVEIGIPIRTLRRYAPDLCSRIAQKCIAYEAEIAREKEKDMIQRVHQEVVKCLRLGIYPKLSMISTHLPHKAYILNPKIRKSIRDAVVAYEATSAK